MAQLLDNFDTYWNLLKGISSRSDYNDFLTFFEKYKLEMMDNHFFDVLLRLGTANNHNWLPQVIYKNCNACNANIFMLQLKEHLSIDVLSRNAIICLEEVCTQLICRGHYDASVSIYCCLNNVYYEQNGFFLLKEMLKKHVVSMI